MDGFGKVVEKHDPPSTKMHLVVFEWQIVVDESRMKMNQESAKIAKVYNAIQVRGT